MAEEKDKEEFVGLINAHQGLINKVVFLYTNNSEDQKDLRQEIISQAWYSYGNYKGKSKFSTWLYRVSLNIAISSLKKDKIKYSELDFAKSRAESVNHAEDLLQIILENLNALEKSIVLLMVEGYNQPEIADILGVSGGNVRVKIYRIRKKLEEYGITEFVG